MNVPRSARPSSSFSTSKLREIVYPDGVIQAVEINAGGIGRDASTLINKVKAAQYVRQNPGEVCPAKWEEGSETLTPSLDLVLRDTVIACTDFKDDVIFNHLHVLV